VEDLALMYEQGKLKKDKRIYQRQVERLEDVGLYENPIEGVKGHHEMMLSTDMCLAYKRNKSFRDCEDNVLPWKVKDKAGSYVQG